jgi:glutaredoxin 3
MVGWVGPVHGGIDLEWLEAKVKNRLYQLQISNYGELKMAKRKVEVFSAGCGVCEDTVELVKRITCPSCEATVLNMNEPEVAKRARALGMHSVPAVVIDGKLAGCCANRGPNEADLRAAGIGQAL